MTEAARARRWVWWLLALAGLMALVGWLWQGRRVEVDVVEVQARPLRRTLQFTARVDTPARVELGALLTGRVEQVLVREGDQVPSGAVLVRLDTQELRAALSQAQATLRQAQALQASQRAVSFPVAQASLAQSEATLRTAERELARTRELLAAGFISQARLDEVQQAVEVARGQRDAAQAQAQANLRAGPQAVQAESQVLASRAAVELAQARLAQAVVRAPAAGRVIIRAVEPGQIVQPGKALLTLAMQGPTELVALVDERFLGQLKVGQPARVLADAFPEHPFDARVSRLAPSVDAQRGAVEVGFSLGGQAPAFLREDMTLSVEVVTGERTAALVLPLRAVKGVTRPGREPAEVLAVSDGRLRATAVTLGLRTLDQVEVVAGLKPGDQVALDATLEAGLRVKPRPVSAPSSGTAATVKDSAGGAMSRAMGG